jgi:hypothetical protein
VDGFPGTLAIVKTSILVVQILFIFKS